MADYSSNDWWGDIISGWTLTPAVTVTSAIEGLRGVTHVYSNQTAVMVTTLIILAFLFLIQRFGASLVGRLFGPLCLSGLAFWV